MRFAEIQRLYLLMAVPVILVLALFLESRRQRITESWISPGLWKRVIPSWIPGARVRRIFFFSAALACCVVAWARPQWGTRVEISPISGLDVMVVLDLSSSMDVEDVAPSRLARSKHWLRTLLDKLDGDRVGLIAFAASAHVVVPLTLDTQYVNEQLQILSTKMVTNQGTDVGLGLELALSALKRGSENPLDGGPATNRAGTAGEPGHAVILITDGEDQEGKGQVTASELSRLGVSFSVLGVGTQKGGPIPVFDDSGNRVTYKKDARGQPIVSQFQPETLESLARSGKGRYLNLSAEESEVRDVLQDLGKLQRGDLAQKRVLLHEDRFQWPLGLGVLLLLVELAIPLSATLRKRNALASLLFVLAWVGKPIQAAEAFGSLDTYLENRKGLQALKDSQLMEAKEHFGRAQAGEPERPELDFNQGVVASKKSDWGVAAKQFELAAKKGGEGSVAAGAYYNQGSALAQGGDMAAAARAYSEAIRLAQKNKDAELEARARKNLELLFAQEQEQKKKNQEKNEDKKEDQKPQDKQKQQEQEPDQQGKPGQDKQDQKKSEPQQGPLRHQRTPFKSEKLKPEDAERVLQELSNKEKQLQQRMKKQGRKGQNGGKDW